MLLVTNLLFAQHKFHNIYSNHGYDRGEGVAQLADSSFIVTGTSTSFDDNGAQIFLLKLDKTGELEWSKAYGGPEVERGKRVFVLSDGFMVFGYSNDNPEGDFNFMVIKTDFDGNEIWTKQYGAEGWEIVTDVQQLWDLTFIVAGTTDASPDGLSDRVLMRLKLDGDTLWTKTFENLGEDRINDIHQNNDTAFVIAGSVYNNDSLQQKAFMTYVGIDGEVIWDKQFGPDGHYEVNGVSSHNGIYLGVGGRYLHPDSTHLKDEYTVRVIDTGAEVGSYSYPSNGKKFMEAISPFVEDGSFYIGFTRDDEFAYEGGDDLFFFKYDFLLNSNFQNPMEIKAIDPEYFGEMVMTSDSAVVIVGSMTGVGEGDLAVFVTKVGPNEDLPTTTDNPSQTHLVGLEESGLLLSLSVYPNPSSNYVKVDWQENEYGTLKIRNTLGQLSYETRLNPNESNTIDVQNWPSGIYFFSIEYKGNPHFIGKLIRK